MFHMTKFALPNTVKPMYPTQCNPPSAAALSMLSVLHQHCSIAERACTMPNKRSISIQNAIPASPHADSSSEGRSNKTCGYYLIVILLVMMHPECPAMQMHKLCSVVRWRRRRNASFLICWLAPSKTEGRCFITSGNCWRMVISRKRYTMDVKQALRYGICSRLTWSTSLILRWAIYCSCCWLLDLCSCGS